MTERVARRLVLGAARAHPRRAADRGRGRPRDGVRRRARRGDRARALPARVAAAAARQPRPGRVLRRRACGTRPTSPRSIRVAARNVARARRASAAGSRSSASRSSALAPRSCATRRARSRKDIAAHYDLGNDLFALMLDPTLMYSCGGLRAPGRDARGGLDRQARARLREARPRARATTSLEIGTGWGGFAVHAATTRGCRVTTTTISREQHDVAVARVRDGRRRAPRRPCCSTTTATCAARYDKLVSLEMIEAVGWQDFGTFFERCSELLAPDGAMLLQAITMDDRAYEVEKASKSFIRTYVFPDGCLPSLEVIARCVARRTDLRTVAPRGPHAALRRDAAALAGELRGGDRASSRRSATTSASAACGGCTSLLRGRLRRAPDRARADGARQAAGRARPARRRRRRRLSSAAAG